MAIAQEKLGLEDFDSIEKVEGFPNKRLVVKDKKKGVFDTSKNKIVVPVEYDDVYPFRGQENRWIVIIERGEGKEIEGGKGKERVWSVYDESIDQLIFPLVKSSWRFSFPSREVILFFLNYDHSNHGVFAVLNLKTNVVYGNKEFFPFPKDPFGKVILHTPTKGWIDTRMWPDEMKTGAKVVGDLLIIELPFSRELRAEYPYLFRGYYHVIDLSNGKILASSESHRQEE